MAWERDEWAFIVVAEVILKAFSFIKSMYLFSFIIQFCIDSINKLETLIYVLNMDYKIYRGKDNK